MKNLIISAVIFFSVSGCSLSIDGHDYMGEKPSFDLERFCGSGNCMGHRAESFGGGCATFYCRY